MTPFFIYKIGKVRNLTQTNQSKSRLNDIFAFNLIIFTIERHTHTFVSDIISYTYEGETTQKDSYSQGVSIRRWNSTGIRKLYGFTIR